MTIKQAFARKRSQSWLGVLIICATLVTAFAVLALPTAAASISSSVNETITTTQAASGPSIQLFEANLSGASEVPAVDTMASGRAVLAVSADGSMLHYRVMLHDITGVTAAHIHEGAAGSNGSSVITLFDGTGTFDESNPVSGSAALTAEQLAALQAGNYYINVHTEANVPGEVRGQISSYTPPSSFNALLTASEEVHEVSSDAVGVARLGLAGNTLTYTVEVSNIMSITAAHIHMGAAGANGGSVFTLFNGEGSFDADNPVSGTATLTETHLVDLLTSHYYINVHTEDNPPGEIRGQIGGARVFNTSLSGANEVPVAVETSASGEAIVAVNAAADMVYYRVMVSNIMSVTRAHIHNAPAGSNGSSIITLFDAADADSGTFDADNPATGSSAITTAQLFDLLSGNHYINVHTEAHGSGEIRGQLARYTPPTEFDTTLSGANEVEPPVETSAGGSGHFELDANLPRLHYQVSVSDIMNVTAAHIHAAAAGSNGPSVFTLYNSTRANALSTFDPANPVGGAFALNAENLVDLLTNHYYVNVHTEANPSGEVRGQIGSETSPTAVTVSALNAGSTSGSLIFALAALGFTLLGGAFLLKRRR